MGKPARQSILQFGLRAILAATFVTAVGCAVLAPFVRPIAAAKPARFLSISVAILFGATACAALVILRRSRVERRCGERLFVVPLASARRVRQLIADGLIKGVIGLLFARPALKDDAPWWIIACALAICAGAGAQFTMTMLRLWWRDVMLSAELCQHGMIMNATSFYPWTFLAKCRWNFERGYLWVPPGFYKFGFNVPSELREEVDQMLQEHIESAKDEVTAG